MHEIASLAQSLGLGDSRVQCPYCTPHRRKKLRDMALTVHPDRVVYLCHHCGEAGAVSLRDAEPRRRERREEIRAMAPMQAVETRSISDSLTEWFRSRGISPDTAEEMGITEGVSWMDGREVPVLHFPYFNKGEVYAQKIRAYPDKSFKCNGAPGTFFGAHLLPSWEEIIITEGEMDALALREAGLRNAISLPHGAFSRKADGSSPKMRYLDHHHEDLKATRRCIIFTDTDEPGEVMATELARRIGRDRCWQVKLPSDCKDANDVLLKHGPEALRGIIDAARPWPVEGLHDAQNYIEEVMSIWDKGLGRGENTGIQPLDNLYSVLPGQMTVVTGHPSNGKSELVDQIMVNLAASKRWRFAVCSFENEPRLHIAKLCSKYIGLPFFDGMLGRMNEAQRDMALKFVQENFSFLYNEDGDLTTLDSIIERLKVAVLRYGISGAVIDPYNYISKPRDMSETEWISQMLSRVRQFAQSHGVHVWFIAHPQKMQPSVDGALPVPKGNSISGSAAWWAKADMGITVHRPDPQYSNSTEIHVWKVRFNWAGRQGVAKVKFDESAQRFLGETEFSRPRQPS